jgi:uncharacterized protein (DUF2235 family)
MKRLVVCCDGTWDTPDHTENGRACPSNVTKLALAVAPQDAHGVAQRVFYGKGVGTGRHDRWLGGAFGWGLSRHILDAYRFLIEEYEPDDQLFLFGFSRGAYTVRSLAGLIRNSGLLRVAWSVKLSAAYNLYRRRDDASHPTGIEAQLFRRSYAYEPHVYFIGVWDTVGSLGIPVLFPWLAFINRRWQFHDVKLSSYVDHAFHALAIDEQRQAFVPTLWEQQDHAVEQQMEQVWFAGVHSNVGGGYADAGLSDLALLWIAQKAAACGLVFDREYLGDNLHPNALGVLRDSHTGIFGLLAAMERPLGVGLHANEAAHASALERAEQTAYYPPNLVDYLARGGTVAAEP